ncbi:MAG: GTPase [Deltaproteobacteria bacterium]|nr:GTPase [Deltaproteobacteria bacterium]
MSAATPPRVASSRTRVVIMGAAGRDFHDFNVVYRDDPGSEVVAFTAAQIPHIDERRYPPSLAGPLYPGGIPIVPESDLESLCRGKNIQQVVFAYSDLPHAAVMHMASRVLSTGADFLLLGPERTMLVASKPVIACSAVRTGCGKSQTTRWLAGRLRERGLRAAVIRHPMPYGDLERQAVQRFATLADLDAAECTVEEREEYEPLIDAGHVVWAGVDYERIVEGAEREADVILWDGGNNDFPFVLPDLHIVLVDPLRPGDEYGYHPGETVLRMADVVVVPKVDAAAAADVERVEASVREQLPDVPIVRGASPVRLDDPALVRGRRVVVVDDGPTLTHGGMAYGAGFVAASRAQPAEIVDPRPFARGEMADIYARFPHLGPVLPAMGYGRAQLDALRDTLEAVGADVVVAGTPSDLGALLGLRTPVVRARYDFEEVDAGIVGVASLSGLVDAFLDARGLGQSGPDRS